MTENQTASATHAEASPEVLIQKTEVVPQQITRYLEGMLKLAGKSPSFQKAVRDLVAHVAKAPDNTDAVQLERLRLLMAIRAQTKTLQLLLLQQTFRGLREDTAREERMYLRGVPECGPYNNISASVRFAIGRSQREDTDNAEPVVALSGWPTGPQLMVRWYEDKSLIRVDLDLSERCFSAAVQHDLTQQKVNIKLEYSQSTVSQMGQVTLDARQVQDLELRPSANLCVHLTRYAGFGTHPLSACINQLLAKPKEHWYGEGREQENQILHDAYLSVVEMLDLLYDFSQTESILSYREYTIGFKRGEEDYEELWGNSELSAKVRLRKSNKGRYQFESCSVTVARQVDGSNRSVNLAFSRGVARITYDGGVCRRDDRESGVWREKPLENYRVTEVREIA